MVYVEATGEGQHRDLGKRAVYDTRHILSIQDTLIAAINYAISLHDLRRFHEAKAILRKTIPVVRRVLGDSHEITFQVRWIYAWALYKDSGATLDNVREAVTTLGESEPIARRVLGGAHPTAVGIEISLQNARAALRARKPGGGA